MKKAIRLLRFIFVYALSCVRVFNKKYCCICGSSVYDFLPYRLSYSSGRLSHLRGLDVVGSDVNNFSCPFCSSHDRERHLLLFVRRTGVEEKIKGGRVLHVAPEKNLSKFVAAAEPSLYVKGDICPSSPDVERVDLQHISYADSSFDVVIANHVLEHVVDDRSALREIARVLSMGGVAVLQTPFSQKLEKTFEDSGIDCDDLRLLFYGQEDHVRLYGRDIFSRFSDAGLRCDVCSHSEVLSDISSWKYGVNAREPFFLFRKL